MTVNRPALETFLSAHAKDQTLVKSAMKDLEPLFLIAEKGEYQLAPASEELRAEAAQAIANARGIPAPKVVFVSLVNPFPKLKGISLEEHEASFTGHLRSLWASLGDDLADSLMDNVGDNFGESFFDNMETIEDNLGESFFDNLGVNIMESLFLYLGHTITGDYEKMARPAHFIRFLPKAIPICEKKDEPNTWLVLVA